MKADWMVVAIAGLTGLVAILASAPSHNALAQSRQAQQCWLPAQLRHRVEEKTIRKHIPAAFRHRPVGDGRTSTQRRHPRGTVIRRVNVRNGKKLVAFTFDLCEQPYEISGYQGTIVDFLRDNNVPATFFASGKWLLTHPQRAQQIIGDPLFEIGNHTWEHRNVQILSRREIRHEIEGSQVAYQQTYRNLEARQCLDRNRDKLAYENAPPDQKLFRFPFGACTPEAIEVVQQFGLVPVQWDVSSSDPWSGQTTRGQINTVMKGVRPGSIVLFHANGRGWRTDDAIPILIRKLRRNGYKFVTVSYLLEQGDPVYENRCYDSRPGDTDRYKGLSLRLEKSYKAFYRAHGQMPTPSMLRTSPLPTRDKSTNSEPQLQREPRQVRPPPSDGNWRLKFFNELGD